MSIGTILRTTLAVAALFFVGSAPKQALAALQFDLDFEFSGATAPTGTAPWVSVTFETVAVGTVTMTVDSSGLTGTEHMKELYFNFSSDAPSLVISTGDRPAPLADVITQATGPDQAAFKADGDGYFDVKIVFDSAPPADRVGPGTLYDLITYTITGAGITESDFDFLSAPGGGNGSYHAAAHIGGIGANGEDSGWIGDTDDNNVVPEPASLATWGVGMLLTGGLALRRRRRENA